jgi:hypothetical protein
MAEKQLENRRAAWVERLGGPPGRYAVAAVTLALIWLQFRLYLDRGDPTELIIARSALYGAVWALMLPLFEWFNRRTLPGARKPRPHTPQATRRGALIGLAVGGPFYTALLVFALFTVGGWLYPVSFAVILGAVVAIAVARLVSAPDGSDPA